VSRAGRKHDSGAELHPLGHGNKQDGHRRPNLTRGYLRYPKRGRWDVLEKVLLTASVYSGIERTGRLRIAVASLQSGQWVAGGTGRLEIGIDRRTKTPEHVCDFYQMPRRSQRAAEAHTLGLANCSTRTKMRLLYYDKTAQIQTKNACVSRPGSSW